MTSRPQTQKDKDDIADSVLDGLGDLLFGSPSLLFDRPGFIASPPSGSPLPDAVRSISRLNCRIWAASDKSSYSTRVNTGNANLCGPYLSDIGELPPDGDVGPPFTGGQCVTAYAVNWSAVRPGFSTVNGGQGGLYGPLGGPVERSVNGQRTYFLPNFDALGNPRETQLFNDTTPDQNAIFSITSVVRQFGGVDDCGDPPGEIRPPGTSTPQAPIPPSIPIQVPGFGPVTVTVNPDVDGDPQVCFEEIDTCVVVKPPGDGSPAPRPPGDVGEPAPPQDTGEGGDSEGEAPEGSVIGALKLNVFASPPWAREYRPGVFRGACYVYMGTDDGLDHDPAGAMLRDGQVVLPELDNLTKWQVRANNGFNIRVTPYYIPVEDTP